MSKGVYEIRHIASGKIYIGSSVLIENRWAVHRKALRENRHHSPRLQNAWNKYGEAFFLFSVIEETADAELIIREQFHIDRIGSHKSGVGYNISRVAGSPLGFKHGPEMRAKMSALHLGRKFSDEHRARISATLKGRMPSAKCLAASVKFHTGRPSRLRKVFGSDDLSRIVSLHVSGLGLRKIAKQFGCSISPIIRVLAAA